MAASDLEAAFRAFDRGQLELAHRLYAEILMTVQSGSADESRALHGLGFVLAHRGRYLPARRIYQRLAVRARAEGNRRAEAISLHQLGMVDRLAGDLDAADRAFRRERRFSATCRTTQTAWRPTSTSRGTSPSSGATR